jgi:uncharacterized protein YkwD
MNKYISVLALLALPACMGGDSGSGVDLTPSGPDATMNANFGTLMNNMRLVTVPGDDPLEYDARLGRAAQLHANDMYEDGYFSIYIPLELDPNGDPADIGTRVNAQGYSWALIAQLIEQGDYSLSEVLAEWSDDTCDTAGTICLEDDLYQDFGLAKAGSGTEQKWVLILTEPN